MSILTRNRVSSTIARQTKTKATDGNLTTTYTAAARGSLPTSLDCRVMQPSAEERLAYQQQDIAVTDVLIYTTDPQVDNRDRITIGSDTFEVLFQRDPQRMGRMYIVTCFRSSRGVK